MTHRTDCRCDQCLLTLMKSANTTNRQRGWEAWYQRDAATVQVFVERRCQALHCLEHSEDIVQDTFLLGFRNVSSGRYVDHGQSLCAYLHGIAKNRLREVARLQRKAPADLEGVEVQDNKQVSLDDRLYLAEIQTLIKEAHEQQPLLHQRVLEGLYGEGKSSNELAQDLRKTADNIRAIARRTVLEIGKYLAHRYKLYLSSSAIRACLELF